jgi:hypothetical protein
MAASASSSVVSPRPPYCSGIERPKRPILTHLVDEVCRYGIGLRNFVFTRDEAIAHESVRSSAAAA